jgi:hypothetical protein
MDWPVPLKVTVPVPGVKVPLLVQLPPTVILLVPAERVLLAAIVKLLATDIALGRENEPGPPVMVNVLVPVEVKVRTV